VSTAVPHATRKFARFAALSATLLTVLGGIAQTASADTSRGATSPSPSAQTATQTVLSASSDTVGPGGSVKVTATVYPGIFVTPSGGVVFKDTTNKVRLGEVKPGKKCILTDQPCPLSITVRASRLKLGTNTITGTFTGDIAETGSSGSIQITRTRTATDQTVTTTCTQGETVCQTPTDTSVDGTASASIVTFGGITAPTETISLSFQPTELPCSTPATGDPLVFSSTNAPNSKIVTYTVFGAAADVANAAYGTAGNICLGSTAPFVTKGFTPPVLVDGLYYGLLPACDPNVVVPPCLEPATFTPAGEDGPSQDEYTEDAIVTASDPRMGH
jgi:hypothetical protein